MDFPSMGERTAGKYNEKSAMDGAIEKYGGKDEKYKLKLKNEVARYLGYSNYINRMNQVSSGEAPMSMPSGQMTPAGNLSVFSGANDLRQKELGYLRELAGNTMDIGKAVADSKLADVKSKAAKGAKDMFMDITRFSPEDDTEADVLDYMRNPFRANGARMPLEDYKNEYVQRMMAESPIDEKTARQRIEETLDKYMPNNTVLSENFKKTLMRQIKEEHPSITDKEAQSLYDDAIQVLPDNIQYEWEKYWYKMQGMSDSQTEALMKRDEYANGKMSPGMKHLYEQEFPNEVDALKIMQVNPGLQEDLTPKRFEDGTFSLSKDFQTLLKDYPQIPPAKLKSTVEPIYARELESDIDTLIKLKPAAKGADGSVGNTPSYEDEINQIENLDGLSALLATKKEAISTHAELIASDYVGMFDASDIEKKIRAKIIQTGKMVLARDNQIRAKIKEMTPDATPEQIEQQLKLVKSSGQ